MKKYVLIGTLILLTLAAAAQEKIWNGTPCKSRQVTLKEYLPEGEPRAAIIVCPGGSYHWLDSGNEATLVAEWLASEGYAAYVLRYRTAGKVEFISKYRSVLRGHRHPDMICDLQRSIQLIRERYNGPVGLIGFSAGGHLVMTAAEFYQTNFLSRYEIEPTVSLRPDFVASIYPVVTLSDDRYVHKRSRLGLLGENSVRKKELRDSLSMEKHVHQGVPPVFLLSCLDDHVVDYHNAALLDSALTVHHVPHHYVQYETGGHGFGANPEKMQEGTTDCWQAAFIEWLHGMSF
ncbi:MAG: alpha/beta hydrolase [Candidatus Cryptobacteroides sp.]|nr:alpha/beta hydrolase [Candidatus Cryptobacteroides sp.]